MASLYSDENFALPVVLELRKLDHDVLTCKEAGKAGQGIPDPLVLQFAVTSARTLLTMNRRHFMRLHRTSSNHAGIIVCTKDDDHTALAQRIHQAILNNPILDKQLIRIVRPRQP